MFRRGVGPVLRSLRFDPGSHSRCAGRNAGYQDWIRGSRRGRADLERPRTGGLRPFRDEMIAIRSVWIWLSAILGTAVLSTLSILAALVRHRGNLYDWIA